MSPVDIGTIAGLTRFLGIHAWIVPSLELSLDQNGVGELIPDWPERRRTESLKADLARLGLRQIGAHAGLSLPSIEHVLGALYVLEGSRLGGRLLARRVAASPDPRVRSADAFLTHAGPPHGWQTFLTLLNSRPMRDEQRHRLRDGAALSFRVFLDGTVRAPHPVPML